MACRRALPPRIARTGVSPDLLPRPVADLEMIHLFVTTRSELARQLHKVRRLLALNGMIWVSWPKKSAGMAGHLTEDAIRAEALPLDLVDIKVCAVDGVWSGLKFVIRKSKCENRSK